MEDEVGCIEVELCCGVTLPSVARNCAAETVLVLAHGLGASNPKKRDHTDKWIGMASSKFLSSEHVGVVAYTGKIFIIHYFLCNVG